MDGIGGRLTRRGAVAALLAALGTGRTRLGASGHVDPDIEQCQRLASGPWCVRSPRRARCKRRGERCCEAYPDVKSRAWARCVGRT